MNIVSQGHLMYDALKSLRGIKVPEYARFLERTIKPRPSSAEAYGKAMRLSAVANFAEPFFFTDDVQYCITEAAKTLSATDAVWQENLFPVGLRLLGIPVAALWIHRLRRE